MASRHATPVAYFDMNALRGVPLNRVHNMLTDVERRFGVSNCPIDVTEAHPDGRYFITFYNRDAADMFERLYRQTGKTPRRLTRLPNDVVLINIDDVILRAAMASAIVFIQVMGGSPGSGYGNPN